MSEAPGQGGHPVGEAARLFREAAQQVLAAADWLDSLDRSTAPDVMLAMADARVKEVNEKLGGWMSRAWTAEEGLRKAQEALAQVLKYIPAHSQGEFFVENFGPDGEYQGAEQINPADIISAIHQHVTEALAVPPAAPLAAEGREKERG